MKLKGINPFEQHVEKIVLGVAVLAVGGVAAWQYLSTSGVQLAGQTVGANEVDDILENKAKKLRTQLMGESNINIPTEGVLLAAPAFEAGLDKSVAPSTRIAVATPRIAENLIKMEASSSDVWYHVPQLAAVRMESVIQTADALTPAAAAEAKKISPTVEAHFTAATGPQDVVWTTPVAKIDVKGIRAELARAEPQAKPPKSAIPGVWYQETPFVVDVQFERREVREDGSFGEAKKVPAFTPADTLSYRSRIANATRSLQEDVFSTLKDPAAQLEILQMPFFETVNSSFVSPAVLKTSGESATPEAGDSRRLELQMRSALEGKKRAVLKLKSDLAAMGGEYDDAKEKEKEDQRKREERERKDAEKGSGSGGGGGGGGGGGMGGSNQRQKVKDSSPKGEDASSLAARKSKTRQLRLLEKEITALEEKLGATPAATAAAPVKVPSLLTEDEMLVWGHDLEVEPGHKYQYRCVIHVYNPFFARGNQLVKEQDDMGLAQVFVTGSKPSEWSETVTVSPRVRFFVTRAFAGDGQLGMGTAQVEVYRLVDGQWRRSEMQVQPGERIGRVDDRSKSGGKTVDFTTDYYVAGIVEDLEQKNAAGGTRKPAFVVVRQLGTGPEIERRPETDFNDVERMQLREDAANTAAAEKPQESTSAPTPPGGSPSGPGGGGGLGGGGLGGGGGGNNRGNGNKGDR